MKSKIEQMKSDKTNFKQKTNKKPRRTLHVVKMFSSARHNNK